MVVHLKLPWGHTVHLPGPHVFQESTVSLSNGPAHPKRVVLVDVFLVGFVTSLGADEVFS